MQCTTEDLIRRYEANESTLAVIFNALRCSRKIGFRLCQYKVSKDLNEYYAALFCFSLIDNSLCDDFINSDAPKKINAVQLAISGSRLLRSHVEFVLSYSPMIDWDGGQ